MELSLLKRTFFNCHWCFQGTKDKLSGVDVEQVDSIVGFRLTRSLSCSLPTQEVAWGSGARWPLAVQSPPSVTSTQGSGGTPVTSVAAGCLYHCCHCYCVFLLKYELLFSKLKSQDSALALCNKQGGYVLQLEHLVSKSFTITALGLSSLLHHDHQS